MKRIGLFLKKQGFFLMLALCLCVIGASALWARSQADAPAQEDVDAGADMAQSLREAQRMRLNTALLEGEEGAPFGRTVWLETLECWGAHEAIDIAAQRGTPVLAAAPGRVTQARRDRLWGGVVEIEHENGLSTCYRGLETPLRVAQGVEVAAGQTIGTVGTPPAESENGAHLHFETWLDGVPVNPALCLP